jgi:pyruvate dehydrogenase E2 component (dihydrolipoamide acetyltransferase)
MPTEFKLPELGENITAGDVVRVLVSPGDTVAHDQPLLELETDKATIEVPSTVSGTVKDIRVKQGDRVNVGQVVLTVDDGGAARPAASEQKQKKDEGEAASDKPKRQPAGAPEEGGLSQAAPEGGTSQIESGGGVRAAAEPDRGTTASATGEQSDRRSTADEPREGGREAKQQKPRGEVVDISRGSRPAPAPAAAQQPLAEADADRPAAPAAPSVRRLARELGIDIRRVTGSGPDGRISPDDVQSFVRNALSGGAAPGTGTPPQGLPDFSRWGEIERRPMSNIRRKTAERLSYAWNAIPHVTQHDKADITALEALRKQYGPQAEKAGGKLTVTSIALKVAERAIRRFPQFNASIDQARNEIVFKKSIHIGIAVDTERGLLVPVIRDVDRKGIIELSVEVSAVSEKARAGKLSLDEMQGGGFTITNLGGIGGTAFTPIVNWPDVAILGISRGAYEPIWKPSESLPDGGHFEPRLMLPLSLSYDHRVIDGADAARFLRWVAEAFEQPFVLNL